MRTALKLELREARAIAEAARITGPQIAWNKASAGAGHKRSTHPLCLATRPSASGSAAWPHGWRPRAWTC